MNNATQNLYFVCYESVGHTSHAPVLDQELDKSFVDGFNQTAREERQYPEWLVRLSTGRITVDDLQFAQRKRCFVTFTFVVRAQSQEQAVELPAPVDLLTRLADSLGSNEHGECVVELSGGWKVLYCEAETEEV